MFLHTFITSIYIFTLHAISYFIDGTKYQVLLRSSNKYIIHVLSLAVISILYIQGVPQVRPFAPQTGF